MQMEMIFENTAKALGGEDILTELDLADFSKSVRRIYHMMKDGRWYSAERIKKEAGTNNIPASEGLRRMRELRRYFTIEKRRVNNSRAFQYRLVA